MDPNLLVLASGGRGKDEGGSGVENLLWARQAGVFQVSKFTVASNWPNGGVHTRVKKFKGVDFIHFKGAVPGQRTAEEYAKLLEQAGNPDHIHMSGYTLFGRGLPLGRTTGIHPGILMHDPANPLHCGGPGFHGKHVHEAVLARGLQETAVCVIYVADEYDTGAPIIAYIPVPVPAGATAESLGKAVNRVEHMIQPLVLARLLRGDISWNGAKGDSPKVPHDYCWLPPCDRCWPLTRKEDGSEALGLAPNAVLYRCPECNLKWYKYLPCFGGWRRVSNEDFVKLNNHYAIGISPPVGRW